MREGPARPASAPGTGPRRREHRGAPCARAWVYHGNPKPNLDPQVYDFCRQPVADSHLAWPELPPRLGLLCAADGAARVSLFAPGLFPLASLDASAGRGAARVADTSVLQVAPHASCRRRAPRVFHAALPHPCMPTRPALVLGAPPPWQSAQGSVPCGLSI